jgi:hypothetical protein
MDGKTYTCDCDECTGDPIAAEYLRLEKRIAELEAALRDAHDPLLISAALLRKHDYNETADMVQTAFDRICALVPTTQEQ